LNKIIEMGRGQLPSNSWLQARLTSNMNINNTCNAYWNGTVNFYRSGGGCSNTGEIAGVFDHEWGHGLDQNDATPGIANPSGEGIADIYTALRLNDSCIGRNFRPGVVCGGYGDPCTVCTGVRDIDYLKRVSGQPHDYSWSNANCSSVHCRGGVYSEAVWSLWKRKLQAAPYNMDNNTAHEVVTRLTFIGAGATGTWFSGSPPFGGCAAGSGYLNYLAADDDNGNVNDGTPHMQAIYDAFNDQEIACNTPTPVDSGCAGI
ncbi:MAG: endopeptidase, partial [Deltaproteobacteria bacterium]|nr:endopeptidase [Deltaproteobacteria bacterium]